MNLTVIKNKLGQLYRDRVLRQWLVGRFIGRWHPEQTTRTRPPYLEAELQAGYSPKDRCYPSLSVNSPTTSIELRLAGDTFILEPEQPEKIFLFRFQDTECLLALHRFSWVPLSDHPELVEWVNCLWKIWISLYRAPDDGWSWHPYTAAERLVNISNFIQQYGVPDPVAETIEVIKAHGKEIYDRLEYFGEKNTGNHLANNGRGLYIGGLTFGYEGWVEAGARILLTEASRIFLPSGMLKEGSSHYHLLITRWYTECWLQAQKYDGLEINELRTVAEKAISVSPLFDMPAGLPIIGDASPDCPPSFLKSLMNESEERGWCDSLSEEEREQIQKVRLKNSRSQRLVTQVDGWWRLDRGPWSLVGFLSHDGWAPMPGHGHEDFGSFELHHGRDRILCDPGRQSYTRLDSGHVQSCFHNTLNLDGKSCYPSNKPYYGDDFRTSITGPRPELDINTDFAKLETMAFARFKGIGKWTRTWYTDENIIRIFDEIKGSGRHKIERFLITTLPVLVDNTGVMLGKFKLLTAASVDTVPTQYWFEYGKHLPATKLTLTTTQELPVRLSLIIQKA